MAVVRKIKGKGEWVLPDGHIIHNPNDFTIKIVLLTKADKIARCESSINPEGKKDENDPKK